MASDPHHVTVTLCAAAAAGVFLVALADRLRVPSIALLLVGGVILGPEVLGVVDPDTLGSGLEVVVAIGVAVILFEGGLTLDIAGFRQQPKVIMRMLTVGVLITWAAAAAAAYAFAGLSVEMSVMAGSLVIVTGPTVVSPLLRRINIAPRLRHVLYWEAVFVDAVGVFVAVLCYELLESSGDVPLAELGRFLFRFVIGAGIGLFTGLGLAVALRRRWIGGDHANIAVLGAALLALGLSNLVLTESGILAVITAGLVLSLNRPPELDRLKRFELELTELGIGILFVLLAAKLEIAQFADHADALLAILAVVILVARPLNVLISTAGQRFNWREKSFVAWMAPRGIVAASMASLFALRLDNAGFAGARFLETMTYAVIGVTVLLQGLSAPVVARALGLRRPERGIWLIIGDSRLAVTLHARLHHAGARSLVILTSGDVGEHEEGDDEFLLVDPLAPQQVGDPRMADVEAVLVATGDPDIDRRICAVWEPEVGPGACYRWSSGEGSGQVLDEGLPNPAELTPNPTEGTFSIDAVEAGPPSDLERFEDDDIRVLFTISDGSIQAIGRELPREVDTVITLHRRVPGLHGLVRDSVILEPAVKSLEDAARQLFVLASREHPDLHVDTKLKEIFEREQTMTSVIGKGLAVPHVYDEGARRASAYVALAPAGLALPTPDEKPVRLIFLLVSPVGKAQEHLLGLAAVARLANYDGLLSVLTSQRTRGRLLSLIRERE